MSTISRRRLLTGGATLLAALLVPPYWRSPVGVRRAALAERLAARFGDLDAVRAVGSQYVRTAPAEAQATLLENAIAAAAGVDAPTLAAATDRDLGRHLSEAVRSDLWSGRTVRLDGWIVARTEGRVIALAHLHDPRGPS